MARDFVKWLGSFKDSISTYDFFVDFNKVYGNISSIKTELFMLNSLVGSKNIEEEFEQLVNKYPEVVKCLPLLIAVREAEIKLLDDGVERSFNFSHCKDKDEIIFFAKKVGLFELLSNHLINNVYDYAMGVEVGLDSNARKNRGGKLMESLVEKYIEEAGFIKNNNYFLQMSTKEIEKRWGLDMSQISNSGKVEKKFDFVVKTKSCVYAIETNFYSSSGSKLNEVSRSYKLISLESKEIDNFEFIWITDGKGWCSTSRNLQEMFDVTDNLFNINDLCHGCLKEVLK